MKATNFRGLKSFTQAIEEALKKAEGGKYADLLNSLDGMTQNMARFVFEGGLAKLRLGERYFEV